MKHNSVFAAVRDAAFKHKLLSVGTVLCAAASVLASLLPPLVLARIIDNLTGGMPLAFSARCCISAAWRWRAGLPPRRRPCWRCLASG